MARYELTISPNYVVEWGVKEAIREIFQNALDQQTVDPSNALSFDYDGVEEVLSIGNKNGNLAVSSLILGNGSKAEDNRTIGQFGEGYKIAFIVLLRMGKSIKVYNKPNLWEPKISYSSKYDTDVLAINVERWRWRKFPLDDLVFQIKGVTYEEYLEVMDSNLFFHKDVDAIQTTKGRILLDEKYKGKVYVSGLAVSEIKGMVYGYDFKPGVIKIGRDRNVMDSFNIYWETSQMWAKAESHKDLLNLMIQDQCKDIQYINQFIWQIPTETAQMVASGWRSKHGYSSYPCASEADATKVRSVNPSAKCVIVTPQLKGILDAVPVAEAPVIKHKEPYDILCQAREDYENGILCIEDMDRIVEQSKHWRWVQ